MSTDVEPAEIADDPEMDKLRDIIRKLEQTQSLLTQANDASPDSATSADSQLTGSIQTSAVHDTNGNNSSPQKSSHANAHQHNGVGRQLSITRGSKQASRKGSRGGSPPRDHSAVNRSVSRSSQYSEDDDDFEFEENEVAANADDESWILGSSKSNLAKQQPNASNADRQSETRSHIGDAKNEQVVNGQSCTTITAENTSENSDRERETSVDDMDDLRKLVLAQEAEMRREAFQTRRPNEADPTGVPNVSSTDSKLPAPAKQVPAHTAAAQRGLPVSSTNLSAGSYTAAGSSTNLQPSSSFQQLQHTPHGSVSSIPASRPQLVTSARSNLPSTSDSMQARGRTSTNSLNTHARSQSVTRGSATDLRAELRMVIDPAHIFDADEKLELQKAQSSSILNKSGISLSAGRRAAPAPRNTSLVGRASVGGRPTSASTRTISQPPATRLSLSTADSSSNLMPSDQINLNSYSEVAASAPSIPGATNLSGTTLASAQRRGIAASSSRVPTGRTAAAQPVSLVRAAGATGRPAARPVPGAPMQRAASQPLRNSAQPAVRKPPGQLGATPLSARSTSGSVPLSARSTGTVPRSSSATAVARPGGQPVPRTVSASFSQRGGTTNRVVTPLSARSGPTSLVRGARPATAPAARPGTVQRGAAVPRMATPLTRGGTVRPAMGRGVTPLTKAGPVGVRQQAPPGALGRPIQRAAVTTQRMPIPVGVAPRAPGAMPIGNRAIAPLVRAPLRAAGVAPLRAAGVAPPRAGIAPQPRAGVPTVPLTRRALEQHTLAMEFVGQPQQPVGLLMVAGGELAPQTSTAAQPAIKPAPEDDSWKEDCY